MNNEQCILVSVIVSTYNRPDALAAVLHGLAVQSFCNFEVIVADDGSGQETADLIRKILKEKSYPVVHAWQEDDGFRAAQARNRAVVKSRGEYLIFLDGDCVPRRDFIARHIQLAERNWFVRGNRIMLRESFTRRVLNDNIDLYHWSLTQFLRNRLNGNIPRVLPALRLPDASIRKLKMKKWHGVKTCNLGLWRDDFINVNGFNEDYQGWGHEDADLAVRLIRSGILRKEGIYSTAVFHLWHEMADRSALEQNVDRLNQSIASDAIFVANGLSRHMPNA